MVNVERVGIEVEINETEEQKLYDFLSVYADLDSFESKHENSVIAEFSSRIYLFDSICPADIENFVALLYGISKLASSYHPHGLDDAKAGSIHTHVAHLNIQSQTELNSLTLLIPLMPRVISYTRKGTPMLIFRTQAPCYLNSEEDFDGELLRGDTNIFNKRASIYIRNFEAFINCCNSKSSWVCYRKNNRVEFRLNETVPLWVYLLYACGDSLIDELKHNFANQDGIITGFRPGKVRSVIKYPDLQNYYECVCYIAKRFVVYYSHPVYNVVVVPYFEFLLSKIRNKERITINTFSDFIDNYIEDVSMRNMIQRKFNIIVREVE